MNLKLAWASGRPYLNKQKFSCIINIKWEEEDLKLHRKCRVNKRNVT